MSLVSVRREYWREDKDSVEAKILGCAGFDDIAPIAIYQYADSKYEKEAVNALKTLKKHCGHIPEVARLTSKQIKDGDTPDIDTAHIYNRLYEMIAEGFGDIAVDKYGAWGHIGECDDEHWGDSSGFFPFYTDEETLRKDLDQWAEDCADEKAVEFEDEMIEAHMQYCSKIDKIPNLINKHISEHDGTRRSLQACHIIEKYNPQDARDMASIIKKENTQKRGIGWTMPMFWDNKSLVLFCGKESRNSEMYGGGDNLPEYRKKSLGEEGRAYYDKWHHWYMDRCVAHADDVDLLADIWKLSPTVKMNYPSEKRMFMGTDIGEGWHNFKKETEKKLIEIDGKI